MRPPLTADKAAAGVSLRPPPEHGEKPSGGREEENGR